MNIFKILTTGDGSIQEPNVSAFFGYLLDPSNEHGLKDALLQRIALSVFDESVFNTQYLTIDAGIKVNVALEKRVNVDNGKFADLDIAVEINKDDKMRAVIAIENKIHKGACKQGQLNEQLKGLRKIYSDIKIAVIYLTPDDTIFSNEFKSFNEDKSSEGIAKQHWLWQSKSKDSSEDSSDILHLFSELLELEARGDIEPIFDYSKHTIKAFMNFIKSDFKSYVQEKQLIRNSYAKPIRNYIEEVFHEMTDDESIEKSVLRERILEKVRDDNPDITPNMNTIYLQTNRSIVNEESRKNLHVNEDHEKYDLFYYHDGSKNIKKYVKNKLKDIEVYWNENTEKK